LCAKAMVMAAPGAPLCAKAMVMAAPGPYKGRPQHLHCAC
jgi:hypothetical protein